MDINAALMIATTIITVAALTLGARWHLVKKKLTDVRQLIDVVDDALKDDRVTEEEFRNIINRLIAVASENEIRQIIQKLRAALKY